MNERMAGKPEYSPEHQAFLTQQNEIFAQMQQVVFDALHELGGDDAIVFLANMQIDLTIDEKCLLTKEAFTDIEHFFPGFGPIVIERWRPLLDEGDQLVSNELRRIEAAKDREILRHYEAMDGFESTS